MRNKIPVIGLTGNIGSGKSTVGKILAEMGAYVIDTDLLSREVMQPGQQAYNEILSYFGESILHQDGAINRRALAELVFVDDKKLNALIERTHKHIAALTVSIIEQIRSADTGHTFIVVEAPLLYEAGMDSICDFVWVVCADNEKKTERIMMRDGLNEHEIAQRILRQKTCDELTKYTNFVIMNNGSVQELKRAVENQLKQL